MSSVYSRGGKLWCRLKEDGRWRSKPTPYLPLPPAAAAARRSREGEPFRGHDYSGKRWREEDLPTAALAVPRAVRDIEHVHHAGVG